jgi:hypothetical protein
MQSHEEKVWFRRTAVMLPTEIFFRMGSSLFLIIMFFGFMNNRLGYGRWQAIVDEPELGLQSVIRNEILLRENALEGRPAEGDLATGSTATNTEINLDNVSDEKGTDDETPPDGPGPGGNKENSEAYMQKKMVDFVKRRVLVLEKVLNAEYLKESSVRTSPSILSPSFPVHL